MQSRIVCPTCGESEELTGSPSADGIRIRCGRCDAEWLRDGVSQTCATCGGSDLETRSRALTQYSRGTQLSIVGLSEILLCRACDHEMLEWSKAGRPVPHTYRSAALDGEAGRERGDSGTRGGAVRIEP
ncbi:MAG: hypothetical protein ACNA76_07695 [Anaerosomatales bacterium]